MGLKHKQTQDEVGEEEDGGHSGEGVSVRGGGGEEEGDLGEVETGDKEASIERQLTHCMHPVKSER